MSVSTSPASISKICQSGLADSRLAKTDPAEPEPTIIKSYSPDGRRSEKENVNARLRGLGRSLKTSLILCDRTLTLTIWLADWSSWFKISLILPIMIKVGITLNVSH